MHFDADALPDRACQSELSPPALDSLSHPFEPEVMAVLAFYLANLEAASIVDHAQYQFARVAGQRNFDKLRAPMRAALQTASRATMSRS